MDPKDTQCGNSQPKPRGFRPTFLLLKLTKQNSPGPGGFHENISKFKDKFTAILPNFLQKIESEGILLNLFCEISVTLIPRLHRGLQISLINIYAKSLTAGSRERLAVFKMSYYSSIFQECKLIQYLKNQ